MKTSGIYKISLQDGRCYVGQSVDIRRRWYLHRHDLRHRSARSTYFQRAWNKYGEDAFSFEVLEEVEPIRELLATREQFWMDSLKPVFNIEPAAGSSLGIKRSMETREKIRAARSKQIFTDETRQKLSLAGMGRPSWNKGTSICPNREQLVQINKGNTYNVGRKASDETRAKMSASQKDRTIMPEHREKIRASLIAYWADKRKLSV